MVTASLAPTYRYPFPVSAHMGQSPRQARQAEELAASWLIKHHEFQAAIRIYGTATGPANELDVLPRDIHAYMRLLERTQKQETHHGHR